MVGGLASIGGTVIGVLIISLLQQGIMAFGLGKGQQMIIKMCIRDRSYSAPFPGREWDLTAHYFATGQLKFDPGFVYKKIPMSQAQEAFLSLIHILILQRRSEV